MIEVPVSRFVRIVVDIGSHQDRYGTGFRLSPTLVLSAWHVVEGARSIQVFDPNGPDWTSSGAAVHWPDPGNAPPLDAVLLSTDPVTTANVWTRYADCLTKRPRWDSAGYVGTGDTLRRHGLHGTLYECTECETQAELSVAEGYPKDVEDWQGVSGAPVMVAGSTTGPSIAGVLSKAPRRFEGRRLKAVAMPALLAALGFRDALCAAEHDATAWYINEVCTLLEKSDSASKAIRAQQKAGLLADCTATPRALAELLCRSTPLHNVSAALCNAYCAEVDANNLGTAATLLDVMQLALPAAYMNGATRPLPDQTEREVTLDVVTKAMAEVVVAAICGRATIFQPGPEPLAELQVPPPGELGIDPHGVMRAAEIACAIEQKLQLEAATTGGAGAHRYIVQLAAQRPALFPEQYLQYLDLYEDREQRLHEVMKVIDANLTEAARENRRFYVVINPRLSSDKEFLRTLRIALSGLLVVCQTQNGSLGEEHHTVLRWLQQVFARSRPKEQQQ